MNKAAVYAQCKTPQSPARRWGVRGRWPWKLSRFQSSFIHQKPPISGFWM